MYNYHILGRLAQERQRELQREAAQAHLAEIALCDGTHRLGQLMRRLGRVAQAARQFLDGHGTNWRATLPPARSVEHREDWAEAK